MRLVGLGISLLLCSGVVAQTTGGPVRNEAAIAELAAGKRTTASAVWWGFDPADATSAIQAAIDSGAKTVVIPFVNAPWIVRPMKLRGNLELVFEPGVLLFAKKDEFQGTSDSMFSAQGVSNLTIRGYGATLRMRKHDYQNPPYKKGEWRMGIAIRGCRNVLVEGLRVESTGGDGFYIAGGAGLPYSENITIRNCVCYDNHRQGISVISAQDLLVENCTFSGTWGTAPESGIDLEPNHETERLVNCVIRNCVFEDNRGHQIQLYLKPFTDKTVPISIRFENCHAGMTSKPGEGPEGGAGIAVGAIRDGGPRGTIEFVNCTTRNTGHEGLLVYDKSADGVKLSLRNCAWGGVWTSPALRHSGLRVPIMLTRGGRALIGRPGGVEFDNCRVYDTVRRPAIAAAADPAGMEFRDVRGLLTVYNPAMLAPNFCCSPAGIDLKVVKQ
ncbi:MAG: right-handed parallel beta-helix repeat-containing protein [Bryobacterales bacterium]|nr:right-handed parallel beta-helix repeat-containing protein [Bryobacterales bacterium]